MNEQIAKNIGNQFGSGNFQNFNSTINFGNFIDDSLEKFICVKKELTNLDFDSQHEIYSGHAETKKGIFVIEGNREFGHRIVTKYLLYSHFISESEEKEIYFISNSAHNPDIVINTCEILSLSENDTISILNHINNWLKIKKVVLVFEDFPPDEFYNQICIPFINYFCNQTDDLQHLHLFLLNSAYLNESIEILCNNEYMKVKEFDFVKLPKLTQISHEQVVSWYKKNNRSLKRYNSCWLNNLCNQNEEVFRNETEEKPQRVFRKIVDSFGLKYQNFINQL